MPKYPRAEPHDLIRTIKQNQERIRKLTVDSPGLSRKSLNATTASLSPNGNFWGNDSTGWLAVSGTFITVSDPPAGSPNPYAGYFVVGTAGVGANVGQSTDTFMVNPLLQYQLSAWVYTAGGSVTMGFSWQNSAGTYISSSLQTISVPASTWTLVSTIQQAVAGSGLGYPRFAPTDVVGSDIYVTGITSMPITIAGAWQDMRPLSNSFVGTVSGQPPPQFRLCADNSVELFGLVNSPPTTGNYNGVTFATLPTGYRPGKLVRIFTANVADGAATPVLTVNASGALNFNYLPTSLAQTGLFFEGRYPLDSSGLILS